MNKGSTHSGAALISVERSYFMRISDVLARVDELKPSQFDDNTKIDWLSELDGRIFNTVIMTHVHELIKQTEIDEETGEEIEVEVEPTFKPYKTEDEELLLDDIYADVYRHWLYAMMDYANGETERYQNSLIMFNAKYQEFVNYYNSTHLPIQHPQKFI